jgi:hypothetical protein
MNDHPEPDPVADLLRPQSAEPDPTFRQRLLRRTRRAVRRRAWLKRVALAVGLAACFAVGGVTTDLFLAPRHPADPKPELIVTPPAAEQEPTAIVLEDRAVQSGGERAALFQQAGERYLRDEDDLRAAVRCYGHALDTGTDANLSIRPEDDWLLMALKHARQEERRHVNRE